ncbi:hypothetical protein R1E69_22675, partial [Escherichia coli]
MSLKSLPECCLTLYLCYSCSTLRKATLIVISGYGVMPSVLKTSFTGETGKWKGGFAPIFPDICYHLTHYKPAAADIPVASDNPAHYADA